MRKMMLEQLDASMCGFEVMMRCGYGREDNYSGDVVFAELLNEVEMGSSAGTLRNGKTTPETRASNFKSKAIDKTLLKAKSEEENIFKILLLGGSECGKTTIFKQMRILHLNGFTKEVSISFRSFIHGNTMEALNQLIDACNSFILTHDISVQEDIARFNDFKKKLRDPEEFVIPVTIGRCMDRIWHSSTIQTAYDRRFSYQLPDSAK
uniref:G-protein alpha subunit n=1 Tax=Heterorhabditis bacteriophora TaxID=37862 RepID=A0A1I7WLE7_HETBA